MLVRLVNGVVVVFPFPRCAFEISPLTAVDPSGKRSREWAARRGNAEADSRVGTGSAGRKGYVMLAGLEGERGHLGSI